MSEHFLLSRLARDLPVIKVIRMSEDAAYTWFRRARWPETKGKPYCSHCGVTECYVLTRRRFKCSGCRKEFTVTSGTIFASRKLPFRQILAIIALSANGAKGKAALELCREIGVQYKTAWANLMKLREALAARRDDTVLEGEVEIDGLYALGHVRPKNRKEERVDRRRPENQSPDRVVVMAIRERRKGGRSVSRVTQSENADCAWDMVRTHVAPSAHVFADEHAAYDDLIGLNKLTRVNHQVAYQHGEGISTNQIESLFARVRRAYRGIHHRFSVKYLDWYVAELSWREDQRRVGNGGQTLEMLGRALAHPPSRNLCGYWQGNKPLDLVWEPGAGG
jgi:transposase-like protein